MVYEKEIDFLLNYDYTEIQKIPGQISSIDETTKAILQELQKEKPLDSPEPTEFEVKILEAIEANSATTTENPADVPVIIVEEVPVSETPIQQVPIVEVPAEKVADEKATEEKVSEEKAVEEIAEEVTGEEVLEEEVLEEEVPVEEVDYLQLLYQEMQIQNENTVQLTEQLEAIQVQNEIGNTADHVMSTYGLIIVPGLIIIYALNKLIKPFTSF